MALKGYFLDNESYSADDVNNAFSHLTTEGVSLFSDTATVTEDINSALASFTSEGVDIYNVASCLVYKTGDVYMVKKGVCFLPDGAFVVVDDDGYTLDVTDGVLNYVYALHDPLKNECKIYTSVDGVPENAVLLAKISAEGKVADKRIFSKAKVAVPTANITGSKTVSLSFPTGQTKNAYTYKEVVFDIGYGGYNYVYSDYDDQDAYVYIGGGEKKFFLDEINAGVWVQKEGNSLVMTTGTWSLNPPKTITVTMKFF